jgi:hypothetical protein
LQRSFCLPPFSSLRNINSHLRAKATENNFFKVRTNAILSHLGRTAALGSLELRVQFQHFRKNRPMWNKNTQCQFRNNLAFVILGLVLHGFTKNFRKINNLVTVALQPQSYLSSKISTNSANTPRLWRISVKQDADNLSPPSPYRMFAS